MGDIINFNKKSERVWQCWCGNASYYIFEHGIIECVQCNAKINPEDVPDLSNKLRDYFEVDE